MASMNGENNLARQKWVESLDFHWKIRELDGVLLILENLAQNAAVQGDLHYSTILLAACQSNREQLGIHSTEAANLAILKTELSKHLAKINFEQYWAKGQALPLEKLIEAVLDNRLDLLFDN
jgi:hypothetical protein